MQKGKGTEDYEVGIRVWIPDKITMWLKKTENKSLETICLVIYFEKSRWDFTGLKAGDLLQVSTSDFIMYYEHQSSFPYPQNTMLAFHYMSKSLIDNTQLHFKLFKKLYISESKSENIEANRFSLHLKSYRFLDLFYYRGPWRFLLYHIIKQAGALDNRTCHATSKSHETTKHQNKSRSKNTYTMCAPEWTKVGGVGPLTAHSRLCNLSQPFHWQWKKRFLCWRTIAVGDGRSVSATGLGNLGEALCSLAPLIASTRRPQWGYSHGYSYLSKTTDRILRKFKRRMPRIKPSPPLDTPGCSRHNFPSVKGQ